MISWTFGRWRFRPRWPATIAMLIALAMLISLGNWQLRRLHWKEGLIAARAAALAAPELPAPIVTQPPVDLDFHHIVATGHYDNKAESYVHSEGRGGSDGYEVITPLHLDDGHILLVSRGFVPDYKKDPSLRADGQLGGVVTIHGVLRLPPHPKAWLVPTTRPDDDFWLFVDIPGMAEERHLPADKMLPYFVEADATLNPGGLPIGGQTNAALPNDHLQYAVTWYIFALTLIGVYIAFHLSKVEEPRDPS